MATSRTSTPERKSELLRAVSGRSSRLLLLAIALLLSVPFDGASAGAAGPSAVQGLSAVQQSVAIDVLPPISQPGKPTATTTGARTVITADVRPKVAGRQVVLERRQLGLWKVVDEARLGKDGKLTFTASTRVGGRAATYRVRATEYKGLDSVHSEPVRADAWGQPAFVDQFAGETLGPAWQHRGQMYNPWGGRNASMGSPAAVTVADGALRLSVLADPARADEVFTTQDAEGNTTGSYAYRLNGHVSTESSFDFQYGVAAARMKFQRLPGQHVSFWMQPRGYGDQESTPVGAEIDVVEWFGKQGGRQCMAANIYPHPEYENKSAAFGGRIANPDRFLSSKSDHWWSGYHVFSVEWTPTEYVFRIDGHETLRTSGGVSHHPEYLILSMLSSDYELGSLGGDEHLAQHAYVDWVQVWTEL
jgi:beta-glucanase (GH16 family)